MNIENNQISMAGNASVNTAVRNNDIYKSLTPVFGKVHQMSRHELITNLRKHNLSTTGTRDVLTKRLKNFYKHQKLGGSKLLPEVKLAPYYLVVDFEATCNIANAPDYPHEIIEFPAVLVSSEKKAIVDHFQSYVRPEINPILSQFCIDLTGITQERVNSSDTFSVVLKRFEEWMLSHELNTKHKCILVTDGPWDMAQFLHGQCKVADIPYPQWAKKWLNVRKVFRNYYKSTKMCNLKGMLDTLGLEFEGRPHCGLDDARNIARILITLMQEGAPLNVNERLELKHYRGRSKALLASAAAIVSKRADGIGELADRLRQASIKEITKKESQTPYQASSKNESQSHQQGEEEGEECADSDEPEDTILWTNNKFSALAINKPARYFYN